MFKTVKIHFSLACWYCMTVMSIIPLTFAFCQQTPKEHTVATLHLYVFDDAGQLPYHVTRFADTRTGVDHAQSFRGLKGTNIPYGQYDYILDRDDIKNPKLSTIRGRVYIDRKEL